MLVWSLLMTGMQLWQSLTFNLGQIRVERRLEFTRLPENWAAVITLGVVVGLCWWVLRTYRAEARVGATVTARMLLASMRCSVILLLTAIWLEPVLATYLHRQIESYALVLVDASASMNIKDYYSTDEEARIPADYFEALGLGQIGGTTQPGDFAVAHGKARIPDFGAGTNRSRQWIFAHRRQIDVVPEPFPVRHFQYPCQSCPYLLYPSIPARYDHLYIHLKSRY